MKSLALFVSLLVVARSTQGYSGPHQEGDLRLVGGDTVLEGRAEVFKGGHWGTICSKTLNVQDWPTVFCQEIGYEYAESAFLAEDKGLQGTGLINLKNPVCNPAKVARRGWTLVQCPEGSGNKKCHHDKDVYVVCFGNNPETSTETTTQTFSETTTEAFIGNNTTEVNAASPRNSMPIIYMSVCAMLIAIACSY